MASGMEIEIKEEKVEKPKIKTFAIFYLKVANFSEIDGNQGNSDVGLTELCIYGIAREEFLKGNASIVTLPNLPRVLHKLKLMINPDMNISPNTTTGLNNDMLHAESPFNQNAGNLVLSFLKHLPQPVCLVAHNGYEFGLPILKNVLERIHLTMPNGIYALDSLRACSDINEQRSEHFKLSPIMRSDHKLDWSLSTQRSIAEGRGWRPVQGLYGLSDLFYKIFGSSPTVSQESEADVETLTKILLHFNVDFVDYADLFAIQFSEVLPLEKARL